MDEKVINPEEPELPLNAPPLQEPLNAPPIKVVDTTTPVVSIKTDLAALESSISETIKEAEAQVEIIERLKTTALKLTRAIDYVAQDGKPYLTITGAEKIAPIFRINVQIKERVKDIYEDDHPGKAIRYWYTGTGSMLSKDGKVLYELQDITGSASSRDDIHKKNKEYLSLSDIDESDIRKSAYSDLIRSAVTRLLGLRSITWEELEKAGIKKDSVKDIARGIQATPEEVKAQEELRQIVKKIVANDTAKARVYLASITTFKGKGDVQVPGIETPDKLTGKRLEYALEKAKRELESIEKASANKK